MTYNLHQAQCRAIVRMAKRKSFGPWGRAVDKVKQDLLRHPNKPRKGPMGRIAELEAINVELRNKLCQEEMNGLCIRECRNIIKRHLGADAAILDCPSSGQPVTSPFFDDLVSALVWEVKKHRDKDADMSRTSSTLAALNVYLTVNDSYDQTGTLPSVWQGSATNAAQGFLSTISATPYISNQMAGAIAQTYATGVNAPPWVPEEATPFTVVDGKLKLHDGRACKITMPDGTMIDLKPDGSYEIIDKDSKVIYRACKVRDFNRFLNASDLLEDFIRFCGEHGTRQNEMLGLPIKLFIGWLILKAAEADGEELPDPPAIDTDLRYPRCGCCGKFISKRRRELRIAFCSQPCIDRALEAPKEKDDGNASAIGNRRKAKDIRARSLDEKRAA